jgi:hypothetical protein
MIGMMGSAVLLFAAAVMLILFVALRKRQIVDDFTEKRKNEELELSAEHLGDDGELIEFTSDDSDYVEKR